MPKPFSHVPRTTGEQLIVADPNDSAKGSVSVPPSSCPPIHALFHRRQARHNSTKRNRTAYERLAVAESVCGHEGMYKYARRAAYNKLWQINL